MPSYVAWNIRFRSSGNICILRSLQWKRRIASEQTTYWLKILTLIALQRQRKGQLYLTDVQFRLHIHEINRPDGKWIAFTGDQLGAIFASRCLDMYKASGKPIGALEVTLTKFMTWHIDERIGKLAMVASTVSSKMVESMALKEGFHFAECLTGQSGTCSWIWSRTFMAAERLRFYILSQASNILGIPRWILSTMDLR